MFSQFSRIKHRNRTRSLPAALLALAFLLLLLPLGTMRAQAQTFYQDTFTGTAGVDLTAHAPNLGAAYTRSSAISGTPILLDGSGGIYASGGSGFYLTTAVPSTNPANYTLSYDIILRSSSDNDTMVPLCRATSDLGNYSGAGIQQLSGVISFQIRNTGGLQGSPVVLNPPGYPTTYHCTTTVSGNNISATISGGELSGTQTISVANAAGSTSNTSYGFLMSPGSPTAHYELANLVGYQGSPTVPTTTITFSDATLLGSVNGDAFDKSTGAGSGYVRTMQVGADVDVNATLPTGGGVVTLNFDTSINTGGAGSGSIWTVEVDGAAPSPAATTTIDAADASSVSTGSLSAGAHRVRFVNVGNTSGSLRWQSYDAQMAKAVSISGPSGLTISASSRPAGELLFLTDSIGEGYHDVSGGSVTNNYFAWPSRVARSLGYSLTGYMISGIGMVHYGIGTPLGILNSGDTSGTNDAWDHLFGGTLRPFTTPPAAIVVAVGTNEWATDAATTGSNGSDAGSTDAAFSANLQTFFGRVRAKSALANTPIYVSVPFGGYKRTPILAAIAAYVAAHPSETKIKVLDLAFGAPTLGSAYGVDEVALFAGLTKNRPDGQDTIASAAAPDRTHPYGVANSGAGQVDGQGQLATVIAPRLTTLIAGGTAATSGTLTAGALTLSGTGGSLTAVAARATGGSAPYTFQFQTSTDGQTWVNAGSAIGSQASTIGGITYAATGVASGTQVRVRVIDQSNTAVTAYSASQLYGSVPGIQIGDAIDNAYPVSGSGLSVLQQIEELYILDECKYHVSTLSPTTHQRTVTYYAANGTTVLATAVQTYDVTNTSKVARTPRLAVNWNNFATVTSGNLLLTTPIDTTAVGGGGSPVTLVSVLRRLDALRAGTGTRTISSASGSVVDTATYYGQGGSGAGAVFVSTITTHSDGSCDRVVTAN